MESITTHLKMQPHSTPSFETAPVQNLLTVDVSKLNQEQLREYVARLRTLRSSPPTFTKALREESDEAEVKSGTKKSKEKVKVEKAAKAVNLDDYL